MKKKKSEKGKILLILYLSQHCCCSCKGKFHGGNSESAAWRHHNDCYVLVPPATSMLIADLSSQGFPINAQPEVGNPEIHTMLVMLLVADPYQGFPVQLHAGSRHHLGSQGFPGCRYYQLPNIIVIVCCQAVSDVKCNPLPCCSNK